MIETGRFKSFPTQFHCKPGSLSKEVKKPFIQFKISCFLKGPFGLGELNCISHINTWIPFLWSQLAYCMLNGNISQASLNSCDQQSLSMVGKKHIFQWQGFNIFLMDRNFINT